LLFGSASDAVGAGTDGADVPPTFVGLHRPPYANALYKYADS
jgi:hypothetical protein